MPIHNTDIAAVFNEIADWLDIQGENPFRIRAYRNAARMLLDLNREVHDMLEKGEDLTQLPGIGEDLAAKMAEIVQTGTCVALVKLRSQYPPGLTELLRLPGLGPKKVKKLYEELKIESLSQLEAAAREGRLRALPGFGEKTEQNILKAIQARADTGRRFLLAHATAYAEALVKYLRDQPGIGQVTVAGSYRRCKETVGDLDILITAEKPQAIMDAFVKYDEVAQVLAHGATKSSVILRSGLQVDVRVVEEASYGAALHYFTGSKAHNIAIRRLGQQKKLKVNEYGVFRGKKSIAGRTEEEVYRAVGLPFIPPELREDSGEIEAAREGRLPKLVTESDLRGDLHVHTDASDGQDSLRDMALAAKARGYSYLAITDHSPRLRMVGGLDARKLNRQMAEIEKLNKELDGFVVLRGIEVDILENGDLDLPDEVLRDLDLVIGAVHSHFKLPGSKQTDRILRAMDHPYFSILAHPTGRLLLEREGYDVDLHRIIRHARERGCFLELNAHPLRLDLDDVFCRLAKQEGVLVAISTDAHSVGELINIRYGVGQARRGWLETQDVLNARPIRELRTLLNQTMGRSARA